ncbi:protein of unknown function (plasmid) [Rhodovastum atsumiense]|nr:protein of unknown function [Rhodovastum atsumiense]
MIVAVPSSRPPAAVRARRGCRLHVSLDGDAVRSEQNLADGKPRQKKREKREQLVGLELQRCLPYVGTAPEASNPVAPKARKSPFSTPIDSACAVAADRPACARLGAVAPAGRSTASYTTGRDTIEAFWYYRAPHPWCGPGPGSGGKPPLFPPGCL